MSQETAKEIGFTATFHSAISRAYKYAIKYTEDDLPSKDGPRGRYLKKFL